LLSPNQERIAFLHRSKLADGGEMTRLCTVGRDGKELRVLASGFLSHFDWLDNNHIMIFGRQQTFVEKLRQGETFYKWVPSPILRYGKKIAKYVYYELCSKKRVDFHWMCFSDEQPSQMFFIAENMIHEMQVRGYRILDYKVMPVIKITSEGDFAITRNIAKLKKKHLINYVLTGTIIEMYNGMVLNVRIVDLSSNLVLSSAQAFIDKKTYFMTVKDINGKKETKDNKNKKDKTKKTDWITPLLD